jgi:hypothetical protein
VDFDPKRHVITLALLTGLAGGLEDLFGNTAYLVLWGLSAPESTTSRALSLATANQLTLTNLVTSLILFPVGALIALYLEGALLRWTGSWLGGRGPSVEVRAALAWSSVPMICSFSLWIPEVALVATNPWLLIGFQQVGRPILGAILGVWTLVVFLNCLGEVHRFSAWKALRATLLGAGVIVVPVGSLWLLSG